MGDFRIKMISCKLISTKEILALKKKKAYNAEKKQTNKQTKQTQESHTKNYISSCLGKKESYPNQITYIPSPPPPLFYPSKVKWSTLIQSEFRVMCKLSNKKNKTSCGEKQQQQPELPKGEFRPARAMCM